MQRFLIIFSMLMSLPAFAAPAQALESGDQVTAGGLPLFARERMRAFVLENFDRLARQSQPLPALSQDAVNMISQSYRPQEVTQILESFNGLFPGRHDPDTDNVIEIIDADDISTAIADKIRPVRADIARQISDGIADRSLCWSGKVPTDVGDIPFVLVSQRSSPAALSNCLYRGVMAHMGVTVLYKDRFPLEGRLNALLSHIANVTAMHIIFECRQHIRQQDYRQARLCIGQRFDELY